MAGKKIIKKNKWARIVSFPKTANFPLKHYVVEASGPYGWILQSDYVTRAKAQGIYKGLSKR
jgi:hypothetical protein